MCAHLAALRYGRVQWCTQVCGASRRAMPAIVKNAPRWSVDQHVECSADIRAWWNRFNHYTDEMHARKFRVVRGKFKPNSKAIAKFYKTNLFHGYKFQSSLSTFPCSFQCVLEDCMYGEHDEASDERVRNGLYYGNSRTSSVVPSGLLAPVPLSSEPYITDHDRAVIHELNSQFVAFMEKCIVHAKRIAIDRRVDQPSLKSMLKHKKHVAKLTALTGKELWAIVRRNVLMYRIAY